MTNGERRHLSAQRRDYVVGHPLALTVGVWAAVSGLAALILILAGTPAANDSSLAILFPTWAELTWGAAYMVGGFFLSVGIIGLSLRAEVAGCSLVAGTQIVNVYAVTVVRGPAAGFVSGVGIAVAAGLIIRISLLLYYRSHKQ